PSMPFAQPCSGRRSPPGGRLLAGCWQVGAVEVRSHDSQAEGRPLPTLLSKKRSPDGPEEEPRHVLVVGGGAEARAGRPVLQALGLSLGLADRGATADPRRGTSASRPVPAARSTAPLGAAPAAARWSATARQPAASPPR